MQPTRHPTSLSEHFVSSIDPRVDRTKEHRLEDILMIALCAMLCGAESFADFGRAKEDWLRTFLALPHGIAPEAKAFARAARGHWGIENQLHWSLDVNFGEDQCRIRAGYASENLAILRHMSLNILKADTTKKRGIKGKQKNAGWDHSYLLSLLKF
ncbi:MAG: ISAs1 family transposase [Verrucomicrobiota bacterium]